MNSLKSRIEALSSNRKIVNNHLIEMLNRKKLEEENHYSNNSLPISILDRHSDEKFKYELELCNERHENKLLAYRALNSVYSDSYDESII